MVAYLENDKSIINGPRRKRKEKEMESYGNYWREQDNALPCGQNSKGWNGIGGMDTSLSVCSSTRYVKVVATSRNHYGNI